MRRLILMRHAKSDWDDPALADHERPLNSRGRKAARLMGGWLLAQGLVPDVALVSTAQRTRETWEGLTTDWPAPLPEVRFLPELYHAAPLETQSLVARETAPTLLVIGHNPGLADLAQQIVADPPGHPKFARFPTCSTLVAEFDSADWAGAAPGSGRVVRFVVPRDLG